MVRKVIGVDNDYKTIRFAKKHYRNKKIEFIKKDLFKIRFPNKYFNTIVSIETLEHVKNCIPFLRNIKRMLKKGGIVILSTPMLRYKNGKPHITNPFHLNEMPKERFLRLMKRIFGRNCKYYAQHQTKFSRLTTENTGFCIAVWKKL
ncbi:MAG TPA: methyltransferase domain-containing protein [Candidatus Pacearchaeota archaeon]|nr:putative S-adenosylmethionine-dependent methyltransferase/MSMEI_2290 [archaeon BMS3Abin17]HDK41798.1 methyltransferase domain-containing protein [Candidatus Pacearchaeota archaeon]HDZ60672.1 methyltransferase domain-containing protein [Candidatus Pacearchaeota archaeon]